MVVRSGGRLLAMLPQVNPATVRDSFRRSLVVYLEQVAGGNVLALAQHIRCPHSIVENWRGWRDGTSVWKASYEPAGS